jgi:hypothetical protein
MAQLLAVAGWAARRGPEGFCQVLHGNKAAHHGTRQQLISRSVNPPLLPLPPHVASVKVFLEETSLVARPAVEFPDLKERLEARMKWLGIKVLLPPGGGGLPL